MSSHSDWLYYVLNQFQPALKSVDIRTFAVCFNLEADWENLITTIIISNKTVETVKAEHELLPQVKNNYCRIFYEAQPFNYQIFEEIAQGEMKFLTVYGNNKVKSRTPDFRNLKLESNKDWQRDPPQIVLKTRTEGDQKVRKKLWDTVHGQKNLPTKVGFSSFEDMIKNCLILDDYNQGIQKDFEITILPPAKIESVQILGKKSTVTIYNPDGLDNLQLNFDLKNHTEPIWIKPIKIGRTSDCGELEINKILPLDKLNLKLIHNKTGLILDEVDVIVPLENVIEPILKTFDTFCSIDEFNKMLFSPKEYGRNPGKIFENAVTWLLSLAGYETLNIGIIIKKPNGKGEIKFDKLELDGYRHVGSADIIGFEENRRLLLIDCDIECVETKKVKKMAEMKKHFRKKLKGYEKLHITPILFTPTEYSKTPPSPDVMIADKAVIKKLFEAVVKGDREEAKLVLNYTGL